MEIFLIIIIIDDIHINDVNRTVHFCLLLLQILQMIFTYVQRPCIYTNIQYIFKKKIEKYSALSLIVPPNQNHIYCEFQQEEIMTVFFVVERKRLSGFTEMIIKFLMCFYILLVVATKLKHY